jgi:hypothetical protein
MSRPFEKPHDERVDRRMSNDGGGTRGGAAAVLDELGRVLTARARARADRLRVD